MVTAGLRIGLAAPLAVILCRTASEQRKEISVGKAAISEVTTALVIVVALATAAALVIAAVLATAAASVTVAV